MFSARIQAPQTPARLQPHRAPQQQNALSIQATHARLYQAQEKLVLATICFAPPLALFFDRFAQRVSSLPILPLRTSFRLWA
jgi:hypothetical protein